MFDFARDYLFGAVHYVADSLDKTVQKWESEYLECIPAYFLSNSEKYNEIEKVGKWKFVKVKVKSFICPVLHFSYSTLYLLEKKNRKRRKFCKNEGIS